MVLPAPEGPTSATVAPGRASKLTSRRPSTRAPWRKATPSKRRSPPAPAAGGRPAASGASAISGAWEVSASMASMSIIAWRISR